MNERAPSYLPLLLLLSAPAIACRINSPVGSVPLAGGAPGLGLAGQGGGAEDGGADGWAAGGRGGATPAPSCMGGAAATDAAVPAPYFFVAMGDLDGDEVADLVVANSSEDSVSVLVGTGNGTFARAVDVATGVSPRSLAIGDLNGDGALDLAVTNFGSNSVSVLLGRGDATFTAKVDFPTGDGPVSVAIGELNGDGKPDLVIATQDRHFVTADNPPPPTTTAPIDVLLGNGDGSFSAKAAYAAGSVPARVALGDLNGDGKLDMAVANGDESDHTISVRFGAGDGTFGVKTDYPIAGWPNAVVTGDLNDDGIADLAVTGAFDNSLNVWLGQRNGTLANLPTDSLGSVAYVVAISDLNGDHHPDLALARSTSVGAFLDRGDGTWKPLAVSAVDPRIITLSHFAVGDLNGDGRPDLALATGATGICADKVNVLLGNGDGTFSAL